MAQYRTDTHSRGLQVITKKRILLLVFGVAVVYFATPVLLLTFALDRFLFLQVDGGATQEDRRIDVPLAPDRSIRIRQYGGPQLPNCAIFFPGRGGGISTYERTLFPEIKQLGMTVYAVSYPGQDGAQGRSDRATLIQDVDAAIATIGRETPCQPSRAVFVGRSLGSGVAIYVAQQFRPKGILLDGVAPGLIVAIRAALQRHAVTRPWNLLPLSLLVKDESVLPVIQSLRGIPIVIFQGTNDDVTPFEEARKALLDQDNVQFLPVPGATHSHVYLDAKPQYLSKLAELAAR
jgi:pimeloyl-ACP methyl ester carboxylesterase